jgi:hypothetical protein
MKTNACLIFAIGLWLSGCAGELLRQQAEAEAMIQQEADKEARNCDIKYPRSPRHNHVANAQCVAAVNDRFFRPLKLYPDLHDLFYATMVALAAKVDQGLLSEEDARLQLAQVQAQITAEWDRRVNARTVTAAQQRGLAANDFGTLNDPQPAPAQEVAPAPRAPRDTASCADGYACGGRVLTGTGWH